MTKNILNAAMVVIGAGSLLTGCSFDQPEAGCFVQDAVNWVVKYDQVEAPSGAECTDPEGKAAPSAERLGVYKFVDPDNLDKPLLTIRPEGLASRGGRDDTTDPSEQTAIGAYAAEPDENDFCSAPELSAARVVAAASPTAAATTITYEFSNVKVYSAPSAPGTQLTGELRYTRDGCTSTYVIRGMWPAVGCDPTAEAGTADNCGEGSGLNPDFAAVCDADTEFCVPAGEIPSLVNSED